MAVLVGFFGQTDPPAASYACLSYCWGTHLDGMVQMTRANLRDHQVGIAVSSLSQTVQDAAFVCQRLVDDGRMAIVEMYSQRKFTVLSDKPTAILGLAEWARAGLPRPLDPIYATDIFTTLLPRHLLWRVTNEPLPPSPTRALPGRIPTWSWASAHNPVRYPLPVLTRQKEETHVHAEINRAGGGRPFDELLLKSVARPVEVMTVECQEEEHFRPLPSGCGLRTTLGGHDNVTLNQMCGRTMARTSAGYTISIVCDLARTVQLVARQDSYEC